ncbi:MAG: hypothetical protein OEZ68_18390 [Gammaproteobacteria bacterium]|nr:hypothetical protein [Gammaproteobacteria bacterium]MDH5802776.1 hypothetical protein [Gammaproteobacteria bacterium]
MRRLVRKITPSMTPLLIRTVSYGGLSVVLYFFLYYFNGQILEYSRKGQWFFFIPVSIAFVFSIVHGNFTGHFWDLFGVKAKTTKK